MTNQLVFRKVGTGKYSIADQKATGPVPTWDNCENLTDDEYYKKWYKAKQFYYYHHTVKELRPFVIEYFGKDWTKEQKTAFNKIDDYKLSPGICSISVMLLNGAKFPNSESEQWAKKTVTDIETMIETVLNEVPPDKVVSTKNIDPAIIRQRTFDKIVGGLDEISDQMIRTGKYPVVNLSTWFQQNRIPQHLVDEVEMLYADRLKHLNENMVSKDPQVREGYRHFGKKDWDNWIKWYSTILSEVASMHKIKEVKTTRIIKPKTPAKLVKKLKYMKKSDELQILSIDPCEIIHATSLWVYNTKTRKLGRYVATENGELTVKGSTLLGFDEKKSVMKNLRKPVEQLNEFKNSGKVSLRTFLDKIKATEVQMNGRISEQVLLLKAFR